MKALLISREKSNISFRKQGPCRKAGLFVDLHGPSALFWRGIRRTVKGVGIYFKSGLAQWIDKLAPGQRKDRITRGGMIQFKEEFQKDPVISRCTRNSFATTVAKETLLSVRIAIITIGLNWIIFNSFIGLIFCDTLLQMLLGSIIDITIFFFVALGIEQ